MEKKKSTLPLPWKILIVLVIGAIIGAIVVNIAHAGDVYVDGHFRQDGTYVQPYHRSSPDGNPYNNYGTQGNINPYTGQQGTIQPQPSYQPYNPYPTNRGNSSICPYGQRC